MKTRQRVFENTKVGGPDDCWLWLGAMDGESYGRIGIDGTSVKVHRVMYNIYFGEIGDYQINHKCDIRNCVNPHHLYKGSQSENIQEMWDRGRRDKEEMRGENNPKSKLTNEQAAEIKERLDNGEETHAEIAQDYPVTKSVIGNISAGLAWSYEDES